MTPSRLGRLGRPTAVGHGAAPVPEPIAMSLRTACDALRTSPEEVSSIAVVSHLPAEFVITAVMDFTEHLAETYGFRAHLFVHDGGLDVRFERQHTR
jgi:hypothetical protein